MQERRSGTTDPGKRLITLNHCTRPIAIVGSSRPTITPMSHGKRKRSPEPPRQSDPFGRPADIAVGSPALQARSYVILDGTRNLPCRDLEIDQPDLTMSPDDGGGVGPRIMFQDADQELPAPGTSTPGFSILGAGYGNRPTSESSCSLRIDSIDSTLPTSRGHQ